MEQSPHSTTYAAHDVLANGFTVNAVAAVGASGSPEASVALHDPCDAGHTLQRVNVLRVIAKQFASPARIACDPMQKEVSVLQNVNKKMCGNVREE